MKILSIDPGTAFCGIAVVDEGVPTTLMTLFFVQEERVGLPHTLRCFRRLAGLVSAHMPDVLLCEDYVYQGRRTAANAPAMLRLIGAIECLGSVPPHPSVYLVHPSAWRRQLVGDVHGTSVDAAVAWVLGKRFPDEPRCQRVSANDGHYFDALGIALTWWDAYALRRHAIENTAAKRV